MIIENNKTKATESIDEELDKIENYVEQALYYARSNTVDKDYYIKKNSLEEMVNECINTDSKWIIFILNQVIQNSIKYRKMDKQSEIEFFAKQGKENVVLYIKDNGMGIEKGEISRVFDKGFTGTNGRNLNKKSTGIGLYLCKKLCDKLGIGIEVESVQNEGTEVRLIFPNSSYISLD